MIRCAEVRVRSGEGMIKLQITFCRLITNS